jgi:tellurite methyltransferase
MSPKTILRTPPLKTDQNKWDLRYSQEAERIPEPDEFLVSHSSLLNSGTALDLACGLGADSIFLSERGYTVHSVDISAQAIFRLKQEVRSRGLSIYPLVADLDYFPLPEGFYDLIMVFYFFARGRMQDISSALRPGGLIFYATFNQRHISVNPTFNPAYLIPPDGLVEYFPDFDIIVSQTAAGEKQNVSQLLARKIVN